jgi:hypothetical protein
MLKRTGCAKVWLRRRLGAAARAGWWSAPVRDHVRGSHLVALPPAHYRRLSPCRQRAGRPPSLTAAAATTMATVPESAGPPRRRGIPGNRPARYDRPGACEPSGIEAHREEAHPIRKSLGGLMVVVFRPVLRAAVGRPRSGWREIGWTGLKLNLPAGALAKSLIIRNSFRWIAA